MQPVSNQITWVNRPFIGRIPRPVELFVGVVLLLITIKWIVGPLGVNGPQQIAQAATDGMMTVLRDDKNLRQGVLFFTKDGQNRDGSVEIRDMGAGLSGLLLGKGLSPVGGSVYFHGYRHKSGIMLTGGPLDLEMKNASGRTGSSGKSIFRIQGHLQVEGIDQSVAIQLEFLGEQNTYKIDQLQGQVTVNQQTTDL